MSAYFKSLDVFILKATNPLWLYKILPLSRLSTSGFYGSSLYVPVFTKQWLWEKQRTHLQITEFGTIFSHWPPSFIEGEGEWVGVMDSEKYFFF